MSVRNTITFEGLKVESSFYGLLAHLQGIRVKFVYDGQSHRSKGVRNSLLPRCKTLMSNKSGSTEDRAVKFACGMGFSAMADRML